MALNEYDLARLVANERYATPAEIRKVARVEVKHSNRDRTVAIRKAREAKYLAQGRI
jgi:hypothetical protein